MPQRRFRTLSVVVCLLTFASVPLSAADVRPISEAERAAVQSVASFLSRGPEVLYNELAADSLFRKLSKADALSEIEARVGPPAGASWMLETVVPALQDRTAVFIVNFPSGIDETVMMDMKREGEAWRIGDLRVLAQKSPHGRIFALPPARPSAVAAAPEEKPVRLIVLVTGLLAVAIAIAGSLLAGRSRSVQRALLSISVTAMAMAVAFAIRFDERFGFVKPPPVAVKQEEAGAGVTRLAALLPLRRAMAAGTADIEDVFRATEASGSAREVADLWKAQWNLQQNKSSQVLETLKGFATPSDIPLAEILRARVCNFEGKAVDSVVAYERAVSLGPGRDGLWYETGSSLSSLGYDDRARAYI
ncbi:MAG: hypothetical protein ABI837_03915, partial [Acidobacteriota bacterium]